MILNMVLSSSWFGVLHELRKSRLAKSGSDSENPLYLLSTDDRFDSKMKDAYFKIVSRPYIELTVFARPSNAYSNGLEQH